MAEFIFGRSAAKKTEYLLAAAKRQLEVDENKRVIVIVPEQQALYWDTLAARSISRRDALRIEVVSFTRLADSVFRRFGGVAKHYITDAEKTLIMWNAMVSVAPRLTVYGEVTRGERYAPMLRRAVSEMKLYGTTPADLEAAADKLEGAPGASALPARLRDLSIIYAAYNEMLHACYDDPEEIPDALCAGLENNDYFSGCAVLIDCFYTLTPKEMKVMSHIFRQCPDVYITFAAEQNDKERAHTEFVWSYIKSLARIAAKEGREVKAVNCPGDMRQEFEYLAENLWNYAAPEFKGDSSGVKIIKCADRTDEAVLCAARIKELVVGGASYSDIAVVASDFEALRHITDTELENCGIPVYVAGKTPVTDQPAMRLLLSACAVASGGWRRDDVVSIASLGLCGLTPDQGDAFEKYTEIWNIRGKKSFCCDSWSMNPQGYSEVMSDWSAEMLRLANEAREVMIPPLEAFCTSFGGTAADICSAAFKLLCDFGVYESLRLETEALSKAGDTAAAQKKSQVWGALMSVLDTVASTVPDVHLDAAAFASMLRRAADECSIGTIPDGIDRVTVGSVRGLRVEGVRHIIVLGAKSGEFPRTPAQNGFFSDDDKELLSGVGVALSPVTSDRLGEEMFLFRHTVSSAADTLTLFIPADEEDGVVRPSSGAARVIKLLPNAEVLDFSSGAGIEAVRGFSESIRGKSFSASPLSADRDRIGSAFAENIFGKRLNMTQSKIECFNDCAFKYYVRYILHLDEGRTAAVSPSDVGNFVHKILENFMREAANEAFPIDDSVIVSRSDRLIRDYIARVCPENLGRRLDYLFERLSRSVHLYARSLNEEFSQSRFKPYSFELPVGFDDSLPCCPIKLSGGGNMSISGVVDRVDVYRTGKRVYLRVADYKTGTKTFSLASVLEGKNVQLLLYLFSLCSAPEGCDFKKKLAPSGEKVLPAGALYFSARPGEASSDTPLSGDAALEVALKSISRSGIVLDDRDVIDAMDSGITGRYAPVHLKNDGEYTKLSSISTEENFQYIKQKMTEALSTVGDRIVSGVACSVPDVNGDRGPCGHCAARVICRHSNRGREEQSADENG